jgi:hypothetical protein
MGMDTYRRLIPAARICLASVNGENAWTARDHLSPPGAKYLAYMLFESLL